MGSAKRQVCLPTTQSSYSAEVLCERQKIVALENAGLLLPQLRQHLNQTKFFLASISPKVWSPRVVAVRQAGHVIGFLHAKERTAGGIGTGIVFGDATLDGLVAAEPEHRGAVFRAGLEALLKRRRTLGVRLLLRPDGYELETLRVSLQPFNVDYELTDAQHHLLLTLGPSYDDFMSRLGPKTRRNFRYYRRKSEAEGYSYVENIPLEEFSRASDELLKQQVVGADRNGVDRALAMFAQAQRPVLSGLRDKNGAWLSLLGGWIDGARPVIFFQMNSDKSHSKSSLCLVLRGYVFETLIQMGMRSVVFWAGVGEPLNRYSRPVAAVSVYVDKRQMVWSGVRHLVANAVRRLPRNMAWRADWIVANRDRGRELNIYAPQSEMG